jgi:hypothetical protein
MLETVIYVVAGIGALCMGFALFTLFQEAADFLWRYKID